MGRRGPGKPLVRTDDTGYDPTMTSKNKRKRTAESRASRKAAAVADVGGSEARTPPLDPPFGYRTTEDGGREAEPEELEVVERMLKLAEKRVTPADIAKQLNKEELTARGSQWDGRAVARVLRRGAPSDRQGGGGRVTSARTGHGAGPLRGASGRGS